MRKNPHVRICGGLGSATTLVYPTDIWNWVEGDLPIHVLPGVGGGPHREVPEFVTPRIMRRTSARVKPAAPSAFSTAR